MPSLCLLWIAALAIPIAVPIGGEVGDVAVRDEQGSSWRLADWQTGRVLVVAFVGAECPLAELYAERLAGLADEYEPRGVAFLGLAPNRRDSAAAVDRFARAHQIPFPILEDQR